jgi:hypothetical protein
MRRTRTRFASLDCPCAADSPSLNLEARALAHRLLDQVQNLLAFLDGAVLPGELELDLAANIAAAEGLLARAVTAIEAAGPQWEFSGHQIRRPLGLGISRALLASLLYLSLDE